MTSPAAAQFAYIAPVCASLEPTTTCPLEQACSWSALGKSGELYRARSLEGLTRARHRGNVAPSNTYYSKGPWPGVAPREIQLKNARTSDRNIPAASKPWCVQ